MKNNNYICHMSYLTNSIAYDHLFWYNCVKWWYLQGLFKLFLKFSFFHSSYLRNCTSVVSGTHVSNDNISSNFFFIFSKFCFFGFSKFTNKCQKQIMRCAPPSSHLCDFSYILVSLKKKVHMECDEIFRGNVNYWLGPRHQSGAFVGSAMGELILNLTLMTPRSVIQVESSYN